MKKYQITVVDDEEGVRETLVELLRQKGFHAEGYMEAEQFLAETFDVRHPEKVQPDLVIIDLQLTLSKMQGMDLVRELARRDVASEILVISGNLSSADLLQAMMMGASDWLAKPFDFFTLLPKLTSLARTGRKRRLHRGFHARDLDSSRLERPVFLSYCDKDIVLASVIKRYLEARSIGVWYAPSTIRIGDPWRDRIREGIKDAVIFIAVLTSDYVLRPYCIDELMAFDERASASRDRSLLLLPITNGFTVPMTANPVFQSIRSRYQSRDIAGHQFLDGLTELLLRVQAHLAPNRVVRNKGAGRQAS